MWMMITYIYVWWVSYSNIRNTARQIPVERSRGKQESRECLYSALLRTVKRSGENFKFLGWICEREYRKLGGSTKLNTIAQSREILNLPLYASCGARSRSWIVCERSWNQFYREFLASFWRRQPISFPCAQFRFWLETEFARS